MGRKKSLKLLERVLTGHELGFKQLLQLTSLSLSLSLFLLSLPLSLSLPLTLSRQVSLPICPSLLLSLLSMFSFTELTKFHGRSERLSSTGGPGDAPRSAKAGGAGHAEGGARE